MNFLLKDAINNYTYKDGELISNRTGKATTATKSSHGRKYKVVKMSGTLATVHRVIYALHHGRIPNNMVIDHIDNNSLNNNIENLQCITQSENAKRVPSEIRRLARKKINNVLYFKSGIEGIYSDGNKRYIKLPTGSRKYVS